MINDIAFCIHCFTYNQENYIRQCLDGFIMQKTALPFLAIVMDDASTDGEQEVINRYLEEHFDMTGLSVLPDNYVSDQAENYDAMEMRNTQLVEHDMPWRCDAKEGTYTFAQHKKNKNCYILSINLKKNMYRVKNSKLKLIAPWDSQAKYLALCEGDDYWTDANKLQKQVDFLEAHPEYSMCFHRAEIQYEGIKGVRVLCDQVETREYSPNELYQNWYVPTASIVCRKECYDVPLVEREKLVNGDVVLMLKCARLGKIYGFADSMSVYRVHSTGVTYDKSRQKYFAQRFPDHYKCIKKNFPFLDKKVANARISHGYYVRAVHPNNILTCLRDLFLAFCYSPAEFMRSILNAIKKRTK